MKKIAVQITDIAIIPKQINDSEVQTVNARELHEFLGVKTPFAMWIQRRIEEYGFKEDIDFIRFNNFVKSNDNRSLDYVISLDMAKELSMVERNAKGKEARKYFIEIEKKYKQLEHKPMSMLDILAHQVALLQAQEREMLALKQAQDTQQTQLDNHTEEIKEIKAKVTTSHSDYYSVAGFANLRGVSLDIRQAVMKGRLASKLSAQYGYHVGKVKDERFGHVNTYHSDILSEIFLDTQP